MKKKILFLAILFFVLTLHSVNAQESIPSVTPTQAPVQYSLPYPGLLPSNPFYFLRAFRDSIMGFLISNPVRKSEYELLQADKNLQAAVYLIQQKRDDKVIITTLITAEDDFAQAVQKAKEAKKQGMGTHELVATLALANKKHQEVLTEISKSTNGDVQKAAVKQLERAQELGKTVASQKTE